jgi:hypothetical protein
MIMPFAEKQKNTIYIKWLHALKKQETDIDKPEPVIKMKQLFVFEFLYLD